MRGVCSARASSLAAGGFDWRHRAATGYYDQAHHRRLPRPDGPYPGGPVAIACSSALTGVRAFRVPAGHALRAQPAVGAPRGLGAAWLSHHHRRHRHHRRRSSPRRRGMLKVHVSFVAARVAVDEVSLREVAVDLHQRQCGAVGDARGQGEARPPLPPAPGARRTPPLHRSTSSGSSVGPPDKELHRDRSVARSRLILG